MKQFLDVSSTKKIITFISSFKKEKLNFLKYKVYIHYMIINYLLNFLCTAILDILFLNSIFSIYLFVYFCNGSNGSKRNLLHYFLSSIFKKF